MEPSIVQLPPNPHKEATIFSKLCNTWTISFFKEPYKRDLEIDDVYEAPDQDKSELLGNRLET